MARRLYLDQPDQPPGGAKSRNRRIVKEDYVAMVSLMQPRDLERQSVESWIVIYQHNRILIHMTRKPIPVFLKSSKFKEIVESSPPYTLKGGMSLHSKAL